MLSLKQFLKGYHLIKENFEFESSDNYIDLVYSELKEKTNDNEFEKDVRIVLREVTKEEWNRKYGFKGRAGLADWLNSFVIKQEKTVYKKCEITGVMIVERVIETIKTNQKTLI
jgi:hypothetical protein